MDNIRMYQIMVPTLMNHDDGKTRFAKTKHHKKWDEYVYNITGGLTIYSPAKGKWVYKKSEGSEIIEERVIPVLIACTEEQMKKIADFTKKHYKQYAVLYYEISRKVFIV